MPYSGADDPDLPSNVKKLPGDKRRQWIAVFNSVFRKSGDDGVAMRQANGAVKEAQTGVTHVISREKAGRVLSGRNANEIRDAMKRLRDVLSAAGVDDAEAEAQVKAFGQKCGIEADDSPMSYAPMFGGATSFEEIQAYEDARESLDDLSELTIKFQAIFQNIMADDQMLPAERAAAITKASADFATAAQDPEALDTDDGEKSVGIMEHVRALFGAKGSPDQPRDEHGRWAGDNPSDSGDQFFGPKTSGGRGKRAWTPSGPITPTLHQHAGKRGEAIQVENGAQSGKTIPGSAGMSVIHDHPGGEHAHNERGAITPPVRGIPLSGKGLGTSTRFPSRKDFDDDEEQGAFASFKDAKGQRRWMATWSNNFYDRDGEVFPESAHKEFINYVDETGDFPELWLWHVPGSKAGRADFIDYDNGMCIASGTFDEGMEPIADALARTKDLAVSHGYVYEPAARANAAHAYTSYRTFEISPLPGHRASNIGTSFAALKEAPMLTAEKRQWLAEIVGPERIAQIEENNRRLRKELSDKGISYKEFVDALAEGAGAPPPPPPPAPKPDDGGDGGDGGGDEGAKAKAVINAPGFKSEDGGKTWVAQEPPKAEGEKAQAAAPKATPDPDFITGIKESIASAVAEAIAPVTTALKEHDAKLEALKVSDDAKIAAAWSSKRWDAQGTKSATERTDNIIDPADEAAKAAIAAAQKANGDDGPSSPADPYVKDLARLLGGGGLSQG